MEKLKENKSCYVSPGQRELLIELVNNKLIKENFFLTGGTALSVFYLYHRRSDDLDLFTRNEISLSELDYWVTRNWIKNVNKINETKYFLSYLINEIKVDFVIDELSNSKIRSKYFFENNNFVFIDNIENIASNKLCVLVSRTEIKDYIDFYYLSKNYSEDQMKIVYNDAVLKDSIFEDIPTVGYQVEDGVKFVLRNVSLYPNLLKDFNNEDFEDFFKKLVKFIYKLKN